MLAGYKEIVDVLFKKIENEIQEQLRHVDDPEEREEVVQSIIFMRLKENAESQGFNFYDGNEIQDASKEFYPIDHALQANLDLLIAMDTEFTPRQLDLELASRVIGMTGVMADFVFRNKRRQRWSILQKITQAVSIYGTAYAISEKVFVPVVNSYLYNYDSKQYIEKLKYCYRKYLIANYDVVKGENRPLIEGV